MSFTFKQYPRIAITVILAGIVSACEQSRLPDVGQPSREPLVLHSSLSTRINIVPNLSTARNVILFIGDGMGVTTVTAARIFDGQSKGMSGEENVLPFEIFPNVALIKTYTANQMVADSAGSASAMNTGVKTRAGVIGIGPQAYRGSCEDALVSIWAEGASNRHYISTARELSTLKADEQVLGLFSSSHMTFVAERESDTSEPGLAEMTAKAIELLATRENGYFLMVEGARIDHGHHAGIAGYALLETQEFARAVAIALEAVDLSDTLVLVTADHSHTLTMGGYTTRGNPILGLVVGNDVTGRPDPEPHLADDGLPYSVLSYANGPGGLTELPRTLPQTN
ncbi:MAG: alkaline phosphatase, partial [Proteobacteria bacterium]|nr:alkaline phosphatase [Pseudomonadota bacterium]